MIVAADVKLVRTHMYGSGSKAPSGFATEQN
jgi:hypothetical protein